MKKLYYIKKNDREFLNGWWIVWNDRFINLAFFKRRKDAVEFKKKITKETRGYCV